MQRRLVLGAVVLLALPRLVVSEEPARSPLGAKVWVGHYAEYEAYLREAEIDKVKDLDVGVTHPLRIFFPPGGLVESAILKPLRPGLQHGYWESYKSEIAAYELDRILGLDMVPVTVERRWEGQKASAQMWVQGCKLLNDFGEDVRPANPFEWARQVCRQRVFDCLIANTDRNGGNILVDDQWNIILIDHSRAFARTERPFAKQITRLDRELFERLEALEEESLYARLEPWVFGRGTVRDLLERRDWIVRHLEEEARKRGEAAVFPF
jgi:hypothetical protein